MGPILFLDLATVTGWAVGAPGQQDGPQSGAIRWGRQGASLGRRLSDAYDQISVWVHDHGVKLMVIEAPRDPRHMKRTTLGTTRFLLGLCGVAEMCAARARIQVFEAEAATIRKFALGKNPRKDPKPEVMAAVKRWGFDPTDDNEADAILGWLYAAEMRSPGSTHQYIGLGGF